MNIKERIEELKRQQKEQDKEIQKLENLLNENWESESVNPNEGMYYYIESSESDGFDINTAWYSRYRKAKHAFRTKEQAELIKEKMLLLQEMSAFAHVKNEEIIPDWESSSKFKWGISLISNAVIVDFYRIDNSFVFGVSLHKKEHAEEMLEIFGERILKYYNEQY